jgi:hypothetical protein
VESSEIEEWELREPETNRVLGTYSAATRPARGDTIEVDGQTFHVRQVADIAAGAGETQRGWLIVA